LRFVRTKNTIEFKSQEVEANPTLTAIAQGPNQSDLTNTYTNNLNGSDDDKQFVCTTK